MAHEGEQTPQQAIEGLRGVVEQSARLSLMARLIGNDAHGYAWRGFTVAALLLIAEIIVAQS